MNLSICECGSTNVEIDLSTNKKTCMSCGSTDIESIDQSEFLKKMKRLEKRISVFGSIDEEDEDDGDEVI